MGNKQHGKFLLVMISIDDNLHCWILYRMFHSKPSFIFDHVLQLDWKSFPIWKRWKWNPFKLELFFCMINGRPALWNILAIDDLNWWLSSLLNAFLSVPLQACLYFWSWPSNWTAKNWPIWKRWKCHPLCLFLLLLHLPKITPSITIEHQEIPLLKQIITQTLTRISYVYNLAEVTFEFCRFPWPSPFFTSSTKDQSGQLMRVDY